MMKLIAKLGLAAVLVSGLSACGTGVENNSEATAQQRKDANALNDLFSHATGTYEGTFSNPQSGIAPHRAKLFVYVVNSVEGVNPDGSQRTRPALASRFQLVDIVGAADYVPMRGTYDDLGQINMASQVGTGGSASGASGGSSVAVISITGSVGNDAATIDISMVGGYWGRFTGDRTSMIATAPTSTDAQDQRQRLLAVYRTIEGSYRGTVRSSTGSQSVEITITHQESGMGGTDASTPYLVGQYRRLDFPSGIGERYMVINYDQLSGRISMNATQGGSSTVPGSNQFAGSGTYANQVLDVSFYGTRGYEGELKATRVPLN